MKIDISEHSFGKFGARVHVTPVGGFGGRDWWDYARLADTPVEAMQNVIAKIMAVTSPSKRGRKVRGYPTVKALTRQSVNGWTSTKGAPSGATTEPPTVMNPVVG